MVVPVPLKSDVSGYSISNLKNLILDIFVPETDPGIPSPNMAGREMPELIGGF